MTDPFNLFSSGEAIFTGTVVCAAAIAYGAGHLRSSAELTRRTAVAARVSADGDG
ncbi:MAG: hypothetical protein ACTHOK_01600 [Nocardioidaceae bacterium]